MCQSVSVKTLGFVTLFVLTSISSFDMPVPFELSISDDPFASCNHSAHSLLSNKATNSQVSLCFGEWSGITENRLQWRTMFMSFQLENRTVDVSMIVRRVLIFAPGATFAIAGNEPVSVLRILKDFELGTHFNGYGSVSDAAHSSVIFNGYLNSTVFVGQIIYQNMSMSHSFQCFHDNNLTPEFYKRDTCIPCILFTYDPGHNSDEPLGWRSHGNRLCEDEGNSSFKQGNQSVLTGQNPDIGFPASRQDGWAEEEFGFPRTGMSDYERSKSPAAFTYSDSDGSINVSVRLDDILSTPASPPSPAIMSPRVNNVSKSSFSSFSKTPEELKTGWENDRGLKDNYTRKESIIETQTDPNSDGVTPGLREQNRPSRSLTRAEVPEQQSNRVLKRHTRKSGQHKYDDFPYSTQTGFTETSATFSSKTLENVLSVAKMRSSQRQIFRRRRKMRSVGIKLNSKKTAKSVFDMNNFKSRFPALNYPSYPKVARQAASNNHKSTRFYHTQSSMGKRTREESLTRPSGTRGSRAKTKIPRSRRSTQQSQSSKDDYTETISCSLHLVADHLFFADMGERSAAKTVNLMLSVIIGADAMFRATDFDGDGVRDNIGFLVKNITIIHNSSMAFYQYSRTNDNSFEYLKSFSTTDFSDVCLGVAFTAINFQRGVVGLAWYASSVNGGAGKGGICGQRVYLASEGSSFSFNTAIVSFINRGSSVSMEKAILTMAHEFGHCFGSSHDDMAGSACNKEYPQGSYLMQRYRPSQYFPNNYKFSPCSLRQMNPVVAVKGHCLTRYMGPTCGNGVVEEGEECDCGLSGACRFNDPCCTPGDAPSSSSDPPCTIRRALGLDCSPVTFSCCSDSCRHMGEANRYVCREATDCYSQASCDGHRPHCPVSTPQPDGTPCHGGTRVCSQGRCLKSLCVSSGLEDCFCQDRAEDRCKLCCQRPHTARCLPAIAFNISSRSGDIIYLPEGDGCLNYRGICTDSSSDRQARYCATVDGLGGDLSAALIDLQSQDGIGKVWWFYKTWPYLLLIPLVPALLAAVVLSGHGVCRWVGGWVRHQQTAYSRARLVHLLSAVNSRSEIFRHQAQRASAVCDRITQRLELQQRQQRQQLWQEQNRISKCSHLYPNNSGRHNSQVPSVDRHRLARVIPIRNSDPNRRSVFRKEAYPGLYHSKCVRRAQSLSDLSALGSSASSLPRNERRRPQRPPPRLPATIPRGIQHDRGCFGDRGRLHPTQALYTRRKLRPTYFKPSIRTPLRRRRAQLIETKNRSHGSEARQMTHKRPLHSYPNSHVRRDPTPDDFQHPMSLSSGSS